MKLETEEQYNTALARAEQIFFAKPGTPEGEELDALASAIEAYEEEHYPMTTPKDDMLTRIGTALEYADRYGSIDGAHHKAWVIDQMVRALTGDSYAEWVAEHKAGEDGPDTYEWDEGIAP